MNRTGRGSVHDNGGDMKLMQGKVRYLLITVMILAVLSSNTEAAEL